MRHHERPNASVRRARSAPVRSFLALFIAMPSYSLRSRYFWGASHEVGARQSHFNDDPKRNVLKILGCSKNHGEVDGE